MIKKLSIAVIAVVVLGALVAAALPREWKVSRSIVIAAPAAKIHPLIVDLKRWQDWSPWTRSLDPQLRNIYEGPADGVGAKWAWLGPKMGRGTITIVEEDAATGIALEERIESDDVNAHARIAYAAEGDGTRVTWTDEGTLPPMSGLFRGSVETELGAHFDAGLAKLKQLAEQ
ncbi:MAG: SRPBCC family protein [Archangium sp.]|nr:SRPBCC family protein [Archangium sp.]